MPRSPEEVAAELGRLLVVFAHPDDETYLAGGLLAAAGDAGLRTTVVTATRGEQGFGDAVAWPPERAARVRGWEADAAMAVLGVRDHRWLELADGGCAELDPEPVVERLVAVVDEVAPDTVLTFGPDGNTGHADHIAVGAWTVEAVRRASVRPRVLFAAVEEEWARRFADLHERFEVFYPGYPVTVSESELAVHLHLEGAPLDRKVAALKAMATQTQELAAAVGEQRYRDWVCDELFVEAPPA